MTKRTSHFLFLIIILLLSTNAKSQGENNTWYFGHNAGLDFNSGNPVALTNGIIYVTEGSASICNASGSLLFYTTGYEIRNRNHVIMPNGNGLWGSWNGSSTQAALIVRQPGSNTIYYVFTTPRQAGYYGPCGCLTYSIVDMSLQSGLGDVTATKNVSLIPFATEKLSAVNDNTGNGIWIMSHEWGNDAFFAYHLTSSGLNLTPVISHCGITHLGTTPDNAEAIGAIKFSPDGTHLACTVSYQNSVELFDFDDATGIVSNARNIQFNMSYGLEFSPSGQYLYVGNVDGPNRYLKQFDITSGNAATIAASAYNLITDTCLLGTLQLGPDQKIYVALYTSAYVGRINNPDLPGVQCNYVPSAVYLDGRIPQLGLTNYNCSPLPSINPKGITEHIETNVISVYPNPFNTYFEIFCVEENENILSLNIFNISGALIMTSNEKRHSIRIENEAFSQGIYFYEVITSSGKTFNGKLVKN